MAAWPLPSSKAVFCDVPTTDLDGRSRQYFLPLVLGMLLPNARRTERRTAPQASAPESREILARQRSGSHRSAAIPRSNLAPAHPPSKNSRGTRPDQLHPDDQRRDAGVPSHLEGTMVSPHVDTPPTRIRVNACAHTTPQGSNSFFPLPGDDDCRHSLHPVTTRVVALQSGV